MIIFNNILQLQNRMQTLPLKNVIFILEVKIKTPLWLNTTYYINVRETRRGIKNEQSRNTGSIGHTRHQNTTQTTKKRWATLKIYLLCKSIVQTLHYF